MQTHTKISEHIYKNSFSIYIHTKVHTQRQTHTDTKEALNKKKKQYKIVNKNALGLPCIRQKRATLRLSVILLRERNRDVNSERQDIIHPF